ncbi:MAG: polysaccharide biosynthesis protein [Candidatus Odinarchaeota archaeon]
MLDNKLILITGGTGTIGVALTDYILANYNPKRIRIFSRDETKQHDMRNKFNSLREKLRFFIGDIRDKERLIRAMKNVDIVFHLAALKHVLASEYNPFEAIKTNIIGIQNLIEVAIDNEIEKVIFTSTDKAASPCNTMGVTKLLGEKLITTANYYKGDSKTIFASVRFGNVLGTRGSFIPLVKDQIMENSPITLTHPDMTRYIMTIDKAIKIIFDSLTLSQGGEVFVPKMDSIRIIDLIEVLIEHFSEKFNKSSEKIQIKEIGIFAGEKLYEELFSIEESERTYELNDMFIIFPQLTEVSMKLDLNKYPKISPFNHSKPFNSKGGPFLSKKQIHDFLIENKVI